MNQGIARDERFRPARGVEQQDLQLRSDIARVRALYEHIGSVTANTVDPGRVLGVVSAATGAEQYLAYTIPRIIYQIGLSGRSADIIIGLNNGFTCESTIESLAAVPDSRLIRLYTDAKPGETTPSAIFDRPDLQSPPYTIPACDRRQHRIFVVHQRQSPYAAGKIRMLGDIMHGLILPSIDRGWRPPLYTAVFDAETVFFTDSQDRSLAGELDKVALLLQRFPGDLERVINILIQLHMSSRKPRKAQADNRLAPVGDSHESGLDRMIGELDGDPRLAMISALTTFCVYKVERVIDGINVRMPDLGEPCSPMHMIYNYTCGILPGCMCMAGGGTIGRTECLVSLLGVIAELYPGTTSEDALLTVLATPAGFRMKMADHVFLTNRCPALHDLTAHNPPRLAWQQQFVRWYAGFDAVEQLYGRHNATDILGPSGEAFVMASLAIFFKILRQSDDVPGSLALLQRFLESGSAYEEIRRLAGLNADVLTGSEGRPAW